MDFTPIHRLQGPGPFSPLAGRVVATRGVVTGRTRKGYFIQDPDGDVHEAVSHGVFVYTRKDRPPVGSLVEVGGRVTDYRPGDTGRPTTQLASRLMRVVAERGPEVEPVWLTAERVLVGHEELTVFLNHLEGMLVGVPAGSTFIAPSNPFGDYVVVPPDADLPRTRHGGVLVDPEVPERWLPGFRVLDAAEAPRVDVGAPLLEPVLGPLNFRVASFQITATTPVRAGVSPIVSRPTRLRADDRHLTVLTLNGFNLDAHVERAGLVDDPGRDIDDDVGDRRFEALARAIVHDGCSPPVVALQEIQDDDGAERSGVVSAERTYRGLVAAVRAAGGPEYAWADVPPRVDADGGQPGGNIRNAYLHDPARVELLDGTLRRLGEDAPAFEGSRKPLAARFRLRGTSAEIELVNVHLASKRHQHGLFAPEDPGFDPRQELRVRQAELVAEHLAPLREAGIDYYVTGDFNDFEFSPTLRALTGDHSVNLVERVPLPLRFDYNHRGLSQALMHGVVARRQLQGREVEYEILHANALTGATPGVRGDKASDHAYVIARLELA